MIRQAVVLASSQAESTKSGGQEIPGPLQMVAGLSLVKRAILTLHQGGIERVWVVVDSGDSEIRTAIEGDPGYARAGVAVEVVDNPDTDKGDGVALLAAAERLNESFVLCTADRVFDGDFAKLLVEIDLDGADLALCVDRHGTDVPGNEAAAAVKSKEGLVVAIGEGHADCDTAFIGVLAASPAFLTGLANLRAEQGDCTLLEGAQHLAASRRVRAVDVGTSVWAAADTAAARAWAEKRLLRSLRKPVDGPVSRNLNRYISLAITRRLLPTRITPNQMTVFSGLLGYAGIVFVFQSTWLSLAIGGLLLQTQSILDGCDGETARLKFQCSALGQWLDHMIDESLTIGYGLAAGWATMHMFGTSVYWHLALGGTAALLFYNAVMRTQVLLHHHSGNPFLFRWWFQKEDAYLQNSLQKGGVVSQLIEVFHSTARRDVFSFVWMFFALAKLPQAIVIWYLVIAGSEGGLALIHVLAGGMSRRRLQERSHS